MQRLLSSKVAANNLMKNQLSFNTATRAFASTPQKNPFDKVKQGLGNAHFYNLPALGDNRLGKCLLFRSCSFRVSPLLHQSAPRVRCEELRRVRRPDLRRRTHSRLGREPEQGRRYSFQARQSYPPRFHVSTFQCAGPRQPENFLKSASTREGWQSPVLK